MHRKRKPYRRHAGGGGSRRIDSGPNARRSQPRNEERRFFDALTKHENSEVRSGVEANRLLRAALAFAASDGAPALLYRLSEVAGSSALRKCLEFITDTSVFEEGFLPLLERLAQDDLNKPVYEVPMNSIILKLYQLPFLVPSIRALIEDWMPRVQNNKRSALAWFFAKIALEDEEARRNENILAIADALSNVGCGEHLRTVLGGTKIKVSITDIRDTQLEVPGGRHDNDKEDFRSIAIIPTCQEFLSDADPYLPTPIANEVATESVVLDRHFRLLREDLIGPSKEEKDDPKKQQRDIFYGVRPVSIETGAALYREQGQTRVRVSGETNPCTIFKLQLPKWFRVHTMKSYKEKEAYWVQNKRILPRDALVCLERRDEQNLWIPVRFGTIVRRETKDLLANPPLIGISFAKDDLKSTLMELSDPSFPPTRLVVVSADLFAYQPILQGLQRMTEIPFKAEIVNAKKSLPAESIMIPIEMNERVDKLDQQQRVALDIALKDRVALIQGPPGTGKSFIGVLLTEIFLLSTSHTILIVTYTNHALDDILEDLLDHGVTDIVRIGGRSRSERLAEYNLRELGRSGKSPFSRDETRRYAHLKGVLEEAEKDVARLDKGLKREIGEKWWGRVESFLMSNHRKAWEQLSVPPDIIEDEQGFRTAGISGTDHLWKCWLKNKKPPYALKDKAQGPLWSLSPECRKKQKLVWQHEMYADEREEMALALMTIKNARKELRDLQQITDANILSKARVIGCTTTKAAMSKSLLGGVGAEVILVEEAAEIREADVLTSLSPGAKRLVMIGDHRQLRPKCQHYPLTVESNKGFDLNVSLFERLALAPEFHIATLGVQHRMHPEISAVPKLVTYNELLDAPKVSNHPQALGLASRVIFIDHDHMEDNQTCDALESVSKTNAYERCMIVKSVQYLLKQGYAPGDIVVLTPYLGQMMKLQAELGKSLSVSLDDRDLNEARDHFRGDDNFSAELATAKQGMQKLKEQAAIRVATIDNFQGEEGRIVLISLVRSNESGQIGFLKEPERVNVMLSRARDCEIVIGNRATLEMAKGSATPLKGGLLWKKIFSHLESGGHIFSGLPTACLNHGTKAILTCPNDFANHCRDGGCMEKCLKERDCEHPCQSFCHPGPCPPCRILVPDVCSRGHPLKKRCSDDVLPKCHKKITWTCPIGHVISGPCFEGKFGIDCNVCVKLQQEEEDNTRREEELEQILLEKQESLSRLRSKIDKAKRTKAHDKELREIERELALAEKELDSFLSVQEVQVDAQETAPESEHVSEDVLSSELANNVRILLKRQQPVPLSGFAEKYKNSFGSVFTEDHTKECKQPKRKKMRKVKEILETLPFIEVVPNATGLKKRQYDVRLRDCDLRATKVPKRVTLPESGATVLGPKNSPETNSVAEEDASTQHSVVSEKASTPAEDLAMDTPRSILPPYISVEKPAAQVPSDCDDTIAHVIQRYKAEGPLKADDLLDEVTVDNASFSALRFLFELELSPGGTSRAPELTLSGSKLDNAICLTSKAMDIQAKFPLQARKFAQQALSLIIGDDSLQSIFPENWVNDLKTISQSTLDVKRATSSEQIGDIGTSIDKKWQEIKRSDPKAPAVMTNSVLPMIGLDAVKNSMIGMYHRFKLAAEQGDGTASSYNVRFEGNPGTGKTTIARHYAVFLQQLMILPEGSLIQETNGAKLIQGGVKGLQDILEDLKDVGGGCVFVDEAYQLASDREGKKVLDFILPLAESLDTEYGCLVWIFAGYKKPLEKLFEHNEGLPSRFPLRFVFEDYSDKELTQIFKGLMEYLPSQKRSQQEEKKSAVSAMPSYSQSSYYGYPSRGGVTPGQTKVCRFGMTWTFVDMSGWTDKYGNRTVNPDQVGKESSKLVDGKGEMWIATNPESWKSDGGIKQEHYPGSPAPIKSSQKNKRETPFHCEDEHLELAIKRLGRRRDDRGFGNARAVRVLFETVRDRQAMRITKMRVNGSRPDIFFLSKLDLLGPDVTADSLKKSQAWADLEKMEGLTPVKESVSQLFKLVLRNVEREKRGEEPLGVSLNRLFLGNPGTGKTTVASIYGRILADLGLLSKGEVILKCASDFVGEHLGSSEQITQGILKNAKGCVLVIDEAYSLYTGGSTGSGNNDPYKTAVIDTIVEKVQAKPGADIAVVMIGYQDEMENMMQHVNPGLSRRFQIEEAFQFPDFNDAALVRIMMASSKKRGVKLSLRVAKRAVRTLAKAKARPHFGNAGAIDNLLSKGIVRMQAREHSSDELVIDDFDYDGDSPDGSTLESLFDDMIGCVSVKEKMSELNSTVVFSRAQGKEAAASGVGYNYLFLGNPGTGKTSVARKMGRMFCALGLLPGDDLVEAKASDLITGYTGQAGKCTRELLRRSLGGTLFIDEAYQMDPARGGHYMTEAVDELVGALTEEEFKGKILVILAGYCDDMERMLKTNPGLKSRFSERVHFDDFDKETIVELLIAELQKAGVPPKCDDKEAICALAARLIDESGESFGNGRDVVTWASYTYKVVAKAFAQQPRATGGEALSFCSTLVDIETALENLLESRRERKDGQSCAPFEQEGNSLDATAQKHKDPPPTAKINQKAMTVEAEADNKEEEAAEEESCEKPSNMFDSIGADVLKTLQNAIDDMDLGSKNGATQLASISPNSKEFDELISRLVKETGLSFEDAKAKLLEWQSLQEDLEAMVQKEEMKTKTLGVQPIWRCGVCGRADKPWIACYVAPFIVRYEKVPLD